ncbi:hypothetical protein C5L38_12920 [Streptomyces sp. WAC00288]|uniref:hypothetical protein n=1 Tax=unclassified Streptomyces TaxID=2593676 RepID=UPI000788A82C|nr:MULTISPECIES: hypothetical protein [unclassified Streptomyces]AVH95866.1 hypothetical protein C5L38_12920 [Streptomyces sp. WAC00288]KYG54529.1 hypothetical protein AWI43_08735 [Streptomyces sp. WAC04657]
MNEPTPEQLAAGEAHGLTPAMCAFLRGETDEELQADAVKFLELFGTPEPPAPVYRSGGPRGVDVGSNGRGTLAAGAALFRERHGLDEDGRPLEKKKPLPTTNRNPFQVNTYEMER